MTIKDYLSQLVVFRSRRYRAFTTATFVLALLIPVCGWTPISALWAVYAAVSCCKTEDPGLRRVLLGISLLAAALTLWGLFGLLAR